MIKIISQGNFRTSNQRCRIKNVSSMPAETKLDDGTFCEWNMQDRGQAIVFVWDVDPTFAWYLHSALKTLLVTCVKTYA